MLISDFFDYSDAYIAVKERITVEEDKTRNKKLTFKINAPFTSCISKINNTFIENAEDLDIVMPIYNMLEYRDDYSMTSGNLWNYYRDEKNADENENNGADNMIKNDKKIACKSFECKITGRTSSLIYHWITVK